MTKSKLGYGLRQVAAYGALISLGLLSIGCGKKATPAASTETPTMTVWQSDFTPDSVEQALTAVGAKKVKFAPKQLPATTFESHSVDTIAGDEAPDIWLIPDDWLEDHRNKLVELPNALVAPVKNQKDSPANLQEFFKQNYDGYINDRLLTQNGAIAFPGPVKPLVLFVNKTLFSEAYQRWNKANPTATSDAKTATRKILNSPLTTWDDLTAAVKLITQKDDDNITIAGMALGTANNVSNMTDIFALLDYQQGNDFVDIAKQTALFNGFITGSDGNTRYPGRDALTFITEFANPASDVYTWNANMPNARKAFLDGKVAMLIDYPDFQNVIKQQPTKLQTDYMPIPQLLVESKPVNVVRYYLIAATKAAASPDRAITLANGLAGKQVVGNLVRGVSGSFSPYKASLSNDKNTTRMFTGARFVYKKHHLEFDAIMNRMIDDVSVRGQAVDVVVNQAANDITALLQRNE